MAKPIVIELQEMAYTGQVPVTDLLRRALVVATKLKINDFREWIENELNGYRGKTVPPYRFVLGTPMALNPVRREWMPIFFQSDRVAQTWSVKRLFEPISEMESLVAQKGASISIDYSAELTAQLNSESGMPIPFRCSCFIQPNNVVGIINKVRDIILQWALKLDEQGILGDGLSFTDKEKQVAMNNPNIHIEKFIGQLRQYNGSTDNSTNNITVSVTTAFDALRQECGQISDPATKKDALATIGELELAKDKPSALAKVGVVAALASHSINIANAIALHFPQIMAWICPAPIPDATRMYRLRTHGQLS